MVCSRGVTAMGVQPIDACSEGSMDGGGAYGEAGTRASIVAAVAAAAAAAAAVAAAAKTS